MKSAILIKTRNNHHALATRRVYVWILYGVCAIWAAMWLFRIIQNINQPAMEFSEPSIVYLSKLFYSGQWAYDISGPPYQVSFYPPVFYYVFGWMMNVFGGTWVTGRVLVILCTLASIGLVYAIVQNLTRNKTASLIACLLPITQYIFVQWTIFIRVDMMAVMFELAGIYIAVRFWKSYWLYASIPLFALAFYTKQGVFVGAIAVVLALAFSNWRQAVSYGLLMGAAVFIPLAVVNHSTNGEFLRQIFDYQTTSPLFRSIPSIIQWLMLDYFTVLPLVMVGLYFVLKQPRHLLALFAGLAIAVNVVLTARVGAAQNYSFEVIFACSIIGGIGLIEVINQKQKFAFAILAGLPIALLFASSLITFPDAGYGERTRAGEALIADATRPILSERTGMVMDAGKQPYMIDAFIFEQMAKRGIWDETPMLNDLKSGQIEYVITQSRLPDYTHYRFNEPVQEAIQANYHIIMDASQYSYSFVIYKANGD